MGSSSVTGQQTILYADNMSFDGTPRSGAMTTDGQLWIGSTASPHVKLGSITATDGSITIGYAAPNITLTATPTTFTCNSGSATPVANNLNLQGSLAYNTKTEGAASTVTIKIAGTTNHAVQIGNASGALTSITNGTSTGQVFQANAGADPTWSTSTYPSTNALGDLIRGSATNTYANLSIPSLNGVPLQFDGTTVNWFTPATQVFVFDDFIAGFGASSGATGQTNYTTQTQPLSSVSSNGNQVAGHPGTVSLSTASSATGGASLVKGNGLNTSDGAMTLMFMMQIPTLSGAGDTFIIRAGFGNGDTATSADFSDGMYFEYTDTVNSGKWTIKTANNTVRTTNNTNSTVDTNWHLYKIVMNAAGNSISFYIDGTEVTNSPIATNIPASTRFFADRYTIYKTGGGNARFLVVDFTMLWKQLSSARF